MTTPDQSRLDQYQVGKTGRATRKVLDGDFDGDKEADVRADDVATSAAATSDDRFQLISYLCRFFLEKSLPYNSRQVGARRNWRSRCKRRNRQFRQSRPSHYRHAQVPQQQQQQQQHLRRDAELSLIHI